MERYIIVSHNLGHQTLANLKAIREHFLEPCSGVFFSHFCSLKPQTVTSAEIFFKSNDVMNFILKSIVVHIVSLVYLMFLFFSALIYHRYELFTS